MQYYRTDATENSLVHECWSLCDANITSYPLADVTRRFNIAYEELVGLIINADGTWQYDDQNYTDHPVGTGTLVEGQQDYAFASEYLQIESVDVLGKDLIYHRLTPVDQHDLKDQSLEEMYGVDSSGNPLKGMPETFDQNGDTIRLYPSPTSTNVTLTAGLRVTFKRAPSLFAVTDTTKVPGLPSSFHSILSYKASLPYNSLYHPERVDYIRRTIGSSDERSPFYGGMTKELIDSYCQREKARPAQMTMSEKSYQ
jgi:hypothetical protein